MSRKNLLVDGAIAGESDVCYIGVYEYDDKDKTGTYYFGAPFFEEYYVALSLEAWTDDGNGFLQVGLGPICPTAYLGDIVYNKDYDHYDPNALNDDVSHPMLGANLNRPKNLVNGCIITKKTLTYLMISQNLAPI